MALSARICRGSFVRHVIKASLLTVLALLCGIVEAQSSPAPPTEIKITARRFEFSPHTITVQKGRPVKLVITAEDVEHGFTIREFNVNVKIEAKQTRVVEFTPDRTGRFQFNCNVYCGDGHQDMIGELVVEEIPTADAGISVSFDDQAPGVAIVESNGVRFRVDTATRRSPALKKTRRHHHQLRSPRLNPSKSPQKRNPTTIVWSTCLRQSECYSTA